MTTHIDQLAEWWENAEEGVINEGDRLIYRDGDNYDFRTAGREDVGNGADKEFEHGWGILSRASKPKPAWHDAVAVIATVPNEYGEDERGVWVPGASGMWEDDMGRMFYPGDLRDVTPLIEAKVTDEMVDAAQQEAKRHTGLILERSLVSHMLAAALGLETK